MRKGVASVKRHRIARQDGSTSMKFGGDALLVLFTVENHAGRAVATGSAMLRDSRRLPTVPLGRERTCVSTGGGVALGQEEK